MLKKDSGKLSLSKLSKVLFSIAISYTVVLTPSYAQQIVPSGMTGVNMVIDGNSTSITSNCVRGNHAFNSFTRFNVDAGKVVNLIVPEKATALFNVVHDERTSINGVLNSLQGGKVGGNIYLINPYGIAVGPGGQINVGSLTAITPTEKFVDSFFNGPNSPNADAVAAVMMGTTPLNKEAVFSNEGQINAIDQIEVATGVFVNKGSMNTDAHFEINNNNLGDIVNLNTIEQDGDMTIKNGQIVVNSVNKIVNTSNPMIGGGIDLDHESKLPFDADVPAPRIASINARFVELNAGANIQGGPLGVVNAFERIRLKSDTGSIGDEITTFNIRSADKAVLYAQARKDIGINELYGNMKINTIKSTGGGDVTVTAAKGVYNERVGDNANIYGRNINITARFGGVGKHYNAFNVDTNYNSRGGKLNVSGLKGQINLAEINGTMPIDTIVSSKDVKLVSDHTMFDATYTDDFTNIYGKSITLTSIRDSIGQNGNDLGIQTNYRSENGVLNASAKNGLIDLDQRTGDLMLERVYSPVGVNIVAQGNIQDTHQNITVPSIISSDINLTTTQGSIGPGAYLNVDVINSGSVSASARNGSINMAEVVGDMRIGKLGAENEVNLIANDGGIYSTNPDVININAFHIFLISSTSIGKRSEPINVNADAFVDTMAPHAYFALIDENGNVVDEDN